MQDMQDRAVGWYRDPGQPKLHRYWNGHNWVCPESSENRLPRQATPRRADDRSVANFDLPTFAFRDSEKDA